MKWEELKEGYPIFWKALVQRAEEVYGPDEGKAVRRFVEYWGNSVERNEVFINHFRAFTEISFSNKLVLDIGCGTAGLAKIVTDERGNYIGFDYDKGISRLAFAYLKDLPPGAKASFIRASADCLPFQSMSFDCVIALDVIEHLTKGWEMQLRFLREVKRVLKKGAPVLLTGPNPVYPYEYHSETWFPQYFPVWLADRYLKVVKPSFLKEYASFGDLRAALLTPWRLERLISLAGLKPLHEYPWLMDYWDHSPRDRVILSMLDSIGCAGAYAKTVSLLLCREEDFCKVQRLKKNKSRTG